MKTLEEKIQYKNHFFKLGQGRVIPAGDTRFWQVFWSSPRDAGDVFELLTLYDVQTVRDQNLTNVLVLVQVLISKISVLAQGGAPKAHHETLNCVRLLTKILPFVFELPNYHSHIEPSFFLVPHFDPVAFLLASTMGPQTGASITSIQENQQICAATLVFALCRLLFLDGFTVDRKLYSPTGSTLSLWEPGLGHPAQYLAPDAIYDSHRSDILRFLLVLVSTTFYEHVPNVVTRGLVFMSLLVSAVPKQEFFSLVCSLANLVCRGGRTHKGDLGLDQTHPSLLQLRLVCLELALQLLALMLAYAMPGTQYTCFLAQNGLLETQKPINRVRAFFARLSKDSEIVFLASHLLGILRSPLLPLDASAKQKTYRHAPSPMAHATLVILWELMHCNAPFKKLVVGRFALKLAPCILYHVYAFYDVPQYVASVKVAAYFMLYLFSQLQLVKSILVPVLDSFMDALPPEFRLSSPVSVRDFTIVHICQILTALMTDPVSKKSPAAVEMHDFLVPTLVECLYNIIPYTSLAVSGTDSTSRGLANLNPASGIAFVACRAINQVLLLLSTPLFLTRVPGNAELLALVLRALCAAATKSPTASRMLLYSFLEEETMYNNIWNSVHSLNKLYFCSRTAKLLNLREEQEKDLQKEQQLLENGNEQERKPSDASGTTQLGATIVSSGTPQIPSPTNDSADQLSIDSEENLSSPNSPDINGGNGAAEISIDEMERREVEEALRPKPPSGMSVTAKEKLPRDTPINVSWGGNDALQTILIFLIPRVKEKLGENWSKSRGSVQDAFKTVKKIEGLNLAKVIEQHRLQLHYDFLPDTPIAKLSVTWNYLSLGWYISMLGYDVFWGAETIRQYMGVNKSLVSNISSSLAMFGKFASGWSNAPKPNSTRQDAAIIEYLELNFSPLNVWTSTSVRLFQYKRNDDDKGIQAFGMRFGLVGLASSVNDITNSLVKRFSDFRGSHRASISSAGSVYSDTIPECARLAKRDSVSSLHSLNTLNRARSNTPRNSMSN